VHLSWGDDGVRRLFQKCFQLLRPGGTLVLEVQEWTSYRSSKHLTAHMKETRSSINFRPQDFPTYLEQVVGFDAPVTLNGSPCAAPLKRPLLLIRRPFIPKAALRPMTLPVPVLQGSPQGSPGSDRGSPPGCGGSSPAIQGMVSSPIAWVRAITPQGDRNRAAPVVVPPPPRGRPLSHAGSSPLSALPPVVPRMDSSRADAEDTSRRALPALVQPLGDPRDNSSAGDAAGAALPGVPGQWPARSSPPSANEGCRANEEGMRNSVARVAADVKDAPTELEDAESTVDANLPAPLASTDALEPDAKRSRTSIT